MKPDPATIAKPWFTVDADALDLSACDGKLMCWSHLGNLGNLSIIAGAAERPSVEFPARPSVRGHVDAHKSLLPAAKEILTSLLHGLMKNVPVVVAAPAHQFGVDGPIAPLLALVEILMPRQWSENLNVRGFTRNPALFLNELKCALIAVPSDAAEDVFEVRRDSILLDEHGRTVEVQHPAPVARFYADEICALAADDSGLIEPVLERLGRAVPRPHDLSDDLEDILALAWMFGARIKLQQNDPCEVLKQHPELVLVEDYDLLSNKALCLVALSNAMNLRQAALDEIERRLDQEVWQGSWDWDELLKGSPGPAMDTMLTARQWREWRAATRCSPAELREAAICWSASPYWRRHEPFLEDWIQVVRDLGEGLEQRDLQRMTDSDVRSTPFPPIAWFEDEQSAALQKLERSAR
jgi:hypothetical protein